MTTATRSRRRLGTHDRRRELVEAALELFGTRPYDDVSMADLADAAGVSHGLVYHYFPKKRDVYLALVSGVTERMLAATRADTSKPPMERLHDGLRAHLEFAERYPDAYGAVLSGGNGVDDEIRELCERVRWEGLEEILRSSGIEDPSPRLRVALRGWAGFQEGAIAEWLKRGDVDRDELLEMIAGALERAFQLAEPRGRDA